MADHQQADQSWRQGYPAPAEVTTTGTVTLSWRIVSAGAGVLLTGALSAGGWAWSLAERMAVVEAKVQSLQAQQEQAQQQTWLAALLGQKQERKK